MPSTFVLHISSTFYNGTTGHRSFIAHIVEIKEDGELQGAPETHGIANEVLSTRYSQPGDTGVVDWLARWREDVKKKMLVRYQMRAEVDSELGTWVGKRF